MKKFILLLVLLYGKTAYAQVDSLNAEQNVKLDELVVVSSAKIVKKANKIIYNINPSDFPVASKSDMALHLIPEITYSSSSLLINDRKKVEIYIDDVPSNLEALKNIDLAEIDKIELITNPSAVYGSEFNGGVINVRRKRTRESYIKADLAGSQHIRHANWLVNPSLSYKNKFLTFNVYYSYLDNDQTVNRTSKQWQIGNETTISSKSQNDGSQSRLSTRALFTLSPKSTVVLTTESFGYRFDRKVDETQNSSILPTYSIKEKYGNSFYNAAYTYKFSSSRNLLIRGRYLDYNSDFQKRAQSQDHVTSNLDEFSGEIQYNDKQLKSTKDPIGLTIGYKIIGRKNGFGIDGLSYNQMVNSTYANIEFESGKKWSGYFSAYLDYTQNKVNGIKDSYVHFLPVFSLLYNSGKHNLAIDYSRKIVRPSAEYLTPSVIKRDELDIETGNIQLKPEINDEVELRTSRKLGKHNLTFALYDILSSNRIVPIYTSSQDNLVFITNENAYKSNIVGFRTTWSSSLNKTIRATLSAGMSYTHVETDQRMALVSKNHGWAFQGTANMSLINPKGWIATLTGIYTNRNYTLTETVRMRPMIELNVRRNLLRNKITIALSARDLLDSYSARIAEISSGNFYRYSKTVNHIMDLSLSVTVHLGKNFSDVFSVKNISNDDIKTKY